MAGATISLAFTLAISSGVAKSSASGSTVPTWRASPLPYSVSTQADPIYNTVVCTSATWCIAGGADNNQGSALLSLTADGGRTWASVATLPPQIAIEIDSLACASRSLCWAIDSSDGTMAISHNDGLTWTGVGLPPSWVVSHTKPAVVGCSATQCLVGSNTDIQATSNGGRTWQDRPLPVSTGSLMQLSCSPTEQCWVVLQETPIPTSRRARFLVGYSTNAGKSWTIPRTLPFSPYVGISCSDATHCSAVGSKFFVTLNGGSSWQANPLPKVKQQNFSAISCRTPTSCSLTGLDGFQPVVWFEGPEPSVRPGSSRALTAAVQIPARWQSVPVPRGEISAFSCWTGSQCIVAAGGGLYRTSNTGQSWAAVTVPFGTQTGINQISCSAAGVCMLIYANDSQLASSSNGGMSWTTTALPPSWVVPQITPQTTSCFQTGCIVAGDSQASSQNPQAMIASTTDGGLNWTNLAVPPNASQMVALGCSSRGECLLAFGTGYVVQPVMSFSANAGASWSVAQDISANWGQISSAACQTARTCFLLGNFLLQTQNSGKTWINVETPSGSSTGPNYLYLGDISCGSGSCWLLGGQNKSSLLWKGV